MLYPLSGLFGMSKSYQFSGGDGCSLHKKFPRRYHRINCHISGAFDCMGVFFLALLFARENCEGCQLVEMP